MASVFSHAVVALSIGTLFCRPRLSKGVWVAGAICSVIPDFDVIGFRLGIRYGDFWGHRGFTHSVLFAVLTAAIVAVVGFRRSAGETGRFPLFAYLFVATASHGVLDAMTNGGLGVAFFSPFENSRYFLPWRPIRVSPIAFGSFFSPRGYAVFQNELLWIWIPAALVAALALMWRRSGRTAVVVEK